MPTRRDFITTAAGVVAASMIPNLLAQNATTQPTTQAALPPYTGKKMGWAFVGIGKLTTGQILPGMEKCRMSKLTGLVTGHAETKAPPIMEKFGVEQSAVYNYDNFDKLADDPRIDIIYNVLPNGMHAEYTIRALKAGKHVLCEKPMANSSAECQAMIDAAKAANRKLMIAYRIRREPMNMKAIEICQGTELGKPRFIITDHTFHIGPNAWRCNKKLAGGGALVDVGIYGINSTRCLTGEEPISVSAQLYNNTTDPRFTEVEEGMAWTMKFPSGLIATLTASYNALGTNRCRVLFEKGSLDMEPATSYHGNKMTLKTDGKNTPMPFPDTDQFTLQMDYFSDCCLNDKPVLTPGEEGLKDQKIIEAIYESANTGKTVSLV